MRDHQKSVISVLQPLFPITAPPSLACQSAFKASNCIEHLPLPSSFLLLAQITRQGSSLCLLPLLLNHTPSHDLRLPESSNDELLIRLIHCSGNLAP